MMTDNEQKVYFENLVKTCNETRPEMKLTTDGQYVRENNVIMFCYIGYNLAFNIVRLGEILNKYIY
jgi:hypothetical protein